MTIVQNVIVDNVRGVDLSIPLGDGDVNVREQHRRQQRRAVELPMGWESMGSPNVHRSSPTTSSDGLLSCGTGFDPNPPTLLNNNISAADGSCVGAVGTSGNISANPHFLDAPNGDYHLQFASPSVDAGNNGAPGLPATDHRRATRIANGTVDQGAYELAVQAADPSG